MRRLACSLLVVACVLLSSCSAARTTSAARPIVPVVDADGNTVYPWEVDQSFNYGFEDSPVDDMPGDPSMNDWFDPDLAEWLQAQDKKDRELTPEQEERAWAQKRLKKAVKKMLKVRHVYRRHLDKYKAARSEFDDIKERAELPQNKDNADLQAQLQAAQAKLDQAQQQVDTWKARFEAVEEDAHQKRNILKEKFKLTACRDFPCTHPKHICVLNPNGTFPFRECGRPCTQDGKDPKRCGRDHLCHLNVDQFGEGGGACTPICKRDTCSGAGEGNTRCVVDDWEPKCVNPCTHASFDGNGVCLKLGLACQPTTELENFNYRCVNMCNSSLCTDLVLSHCMMMKGQATCVDPCEKICQDNEVCIRKTINIDGAERSLFKCKNACPRLWWENPCRDNKVKTRCVGLGHEATCQHPCYEHNCDKAFQRCVPHPNKKGKFVGKYSCEDL